MLSGLLLCCMLVTFLIHQTVERLIPYLSKQARKFSGVPVQCGQTSLSLTTRSETLDANRFSVAFTIIHIDMCSIILAILSNSTLSACNEAHSLTWFGARWIDFWMSFWQPVLGQTSCLRSTCRLQGAEVTKSCQIYRGHRASLVLPTLVGLTACFTIGKGSTVLVAGSLVWRFFQQRYAAHKELHVRVRSIPSAFGSSVKTKERIKSRKGVLELPDIVLTRSLYMRPSGMSWQLDETQTPKKNEKKELKIANE